MTSFDLSGIDTPALVLDEARMRANIRRLADRLAPFDVVLRPHLKTAKSVDVARQLLAGGNGPATVSTLREAEYFAAAGVRDILYAVGIAPGKLGRVKALRSEEHTSELQSLMRISYAVFCLKKNNTHKM